MSNAGPHGINYKRAYSSTADFPFTLGDYVWHRDGVFQFGQANGAVVVYDAVKLDNDGQIAQITTTITGDEPTGVGLAQVAAADNEYLWVFRGLGGGSGKGIKANLLINCAQDVRLYTTATAGSLDDTATDLIANVSLITTITAATAAEIYSPGIMVFLGG